MFHSSKEKIQNMLNYYYKTSRIRYAAYLKEVKDIGRVFVNEKGEHRVIIEDIDFKCSDY